MPPSPVPCGFHTVTPYLVLRDVPAVVAFLARAFEAVEVARSAMPDGTILNVEVRVGDSMLLMGEARDIQPPRPGIFYLYVPDADAVYRRAVEAGGVSLIEPATMFYGDRSGAVRDPGGNEWWIASRIEEVAGDELTRRAMAREAARSGRVPELLAAVTTGDEPAARAALEAAPSLAWARSDAGVSAVCLAAYHGRSGIARLLADARQDLDIFEASVLGDRDRAAVLIGRDPGLVGAFSPDGFQPLGYACFFGHPAVVELLLGSGADVNTPARSAPEVRPIHSAAAHRDPAVSLAIAKRLLEVGADPNVAQAGGYTPLLQAAHAGHLELVRLLLDHGADRTARAADGRTALDLARAGGHADVAVLLEA